MSIIFLLEYNPAMHDIAFRKLILTHWKKHGRHDLPWRATTDPYAILVSEIMLQQTQVLRVVDKYIAFLAAFPTFRTLASAPTSRVLRVWQGLGYNRRALMLQRCAKAVCELHGGSLPQNYEALCMLPGIGPYTAGAVMAFAFNKPVPVIETNIRRIYLHHFFEGRRKVPDAKLLPVVRRTLDLRNPRRWYSALMDYGTWLATQTPNPNTRSKHYTRQSKFEGSDRQVRGAIIRHLTENPRVHATVVARRTGHPVAKLQSLLPKLEREGFVTRCTHARCVHNPHWSLVG